MSGSLAEPVSEVRHAVKPVRVVVISEEACERQQLTRALEGLPGIEVVAVVDLVCQMGKQACLCGARLPVRSTQTGRQAGNVDADCVVLDIDCYPLAGTLGLAQVRGTFPGARVIVLVRSIHPRFRQFLKESGASCCIDKDDPGMVTQLISACQPFTGVQSRGVSSAHTA